MRLDVATEAQRRFGNDVGRDAGQELFERFVTVEDDTVPANRAPVVGVVRGVVGGLVVRSA